VLPRPEPRSASGNPPFYQVGGHRYIVLASADNYDERGVASWYGRDFHGGRTATGEQYNMYAMSAAHKTLPIPCYARVTNLGNGRSVIVRINDRGPFVGKRLIDLSYAAAEKLDMVRDGTAFVEVATVSGAAAESPPPAPLTHTFYIQIGAYANADNATRVARRLRAAGIEHVFTLAPSPGEPLQRVRIGPLSSVEEFDGFMARLEPLGFADARLAQD
jgi:rare lipoprotein A